MDKMLSELAKPFPRELISWRVGATNKKNKKPDAPLKGIALAYIDARDVMERLDSVCGIGGWQSKHPHAGAKTSCAIGIKVNDEWLWKENGAGDSATEAEKGAFSDSFKRTAVIWGIGRYLYNVENVWVELDNWGKIKNPNDPKLMKALENAEKGIITNEPKPKQQELEPKIDLNHKFEVCKKQIEDSSDISILKYVWDGLAPDLLIIKNASADKYAELEQIKNKKKAELS